MKVGLFFGSFNPVHIGHMIIANYMASQTDLDRVWMVLTPQNPFKSQASLAKDYDRLHLLKLSIDNNPLLEASNIEFSLPKPSYTIDTLTYLKEIHPNKEFALIMGGDNLSSFHKWKNHELIIRDHEIYVYRRPSHTHEKWENHPKVKIHDAPLMQISASYIRKCIKSGHSVKYLVTDTVYDYLNNSRLYK